MVRSVPQRLPFSQSYQVGAEFLTKKISALYIEAVKDYTNGEMLEAKMTETTPYITTDPRDIAVILRYFSDFVFRSG